MDDLNNLRKSAKSVDVTNIKIHNFFGFTLLEIMIAIFIFAIIITTLFGSYTTVFSSAKTINEDTAKYEAAKNCINRIALDLNSTHVSVPPEYSPPDFNDSADPYRITGDIIHTGNTSFSRLRFTSLAHISFEKNIQNGIAEIIYYVHADNEGNYVLRRSDNLYPYEEFEEKGSDPMLCEGVKSLEFKYYDQDGAKYELWDSDSENFKNATPRAIEIKLDLGDVEDDSNALLFETIIMLPVFREKIG